MLEGLQTGQTLRGDYFTKKNITQFMDINLNYQGRKVNFQNYSYWKHPTKSLFLNIINSLIISFKLRHNMYLAR
jgi:hypothetical protein